MTAASDPRGRGGATVPGLSATRLAAVPMFAGAGLLIGAWALLPRYMGPQIHLGPRAHEIEFVDHAIPGVAVIVLSLVALGLWRRPRPFTATLLFSTGMGVGIAGVWMTATHLPLVRQALQDEAPWDATLHHSLPSFTVLVFGIGWCLTYRSPAPGPSPS